MEGKTIPRELEGFADSRIIGYKSTSNAQEERIFFKLKINIENLDSQFPLGSKLTTDTFKAEFEEDEKGRRIKIFFEQGTGLGTKVAQWNQNNDIDLLSRFEIVEMVQPCELDGLILHNSDYGGLSTGSYNEDGLQYFIIQLRGITKVYNSTGQTTEFLLNDEGFRAVEMNYEYPSRFDHSKDEYKWTPQNMVKDYIQFEKIKFKPGHNFYKPTKHSDPIVSIHKEPRILVLHENLSEEEVRKHVELLLALYSLYSHSEIDYVCSRIQTPTKVYYHTRAAKKYEHDGHGGFRFEFRQNPLNLIANVDTTRLLGKHEFVTNLIRRFYSSLEAEPESKFMILYSVLEQIRNQYILDSKIEQEKAGEVPNLKKVVEEFRFTGTRNSQDQFIEEQLTKIAEIVEEEDKQAFLEEIKFKVGNIRLMTMANQFRSLFEHLNIDPAKHGLDFDKIRKLRNTIFHGTPVGGSREYLEQIIKYRQLPKFVGTILFKYLGIDDLSKIEGEWRD